MPMDSWIFLWKLLAKVSFAHQFSLPLVGYKYMYEKCDWTKTSINIHKCKYQSNKSCRQQVLGNILP